MQFPILSMPIITGIILTIKTRVNHFNNLKNHDPRKTANGNSAITPDEIDAG